MRWVDYGALMLVVCLARDINAAVLDNSTAPTLTTSKPINVTSSTHSTTLPPTTTDENQYQGVNCSSAPCKNGATCRDEGNTFLCMCACGYGGRICDIVVDNGGCWSSPCRNGGTCYWADDDIAYRCLCDERYFTGFNCDEGHSPCNSNPCRNGGACNANTTTWTYTCSCGCDFTGRYCETDLNPCSSQPCLHGGSCFRQGTTGHYVCACPEGYAGLNCDFIGLLLKDNLALGRPVYQSTLAAGSYSPKNLVDGTRDYNVSLGTCSATTPEARPWIVVDFENVTDVKHVVITGWTFGSNGNYETCRVSSTGIEYTGTKATTLAGPCKTWASSSTYQLPENYCRNPDPVAHKSGPWCYVTNNHYDFYDCAIPFCESNHLSDFIIGMTNDYPPVYGNYSVCAQYPGVLLSPTVSVTCGPGLIPGRYLVLQIPVALTSIYVCEIEAYTNATLSK